MNRVVVTRFPPIFQRSQCTRTEIPLRVSKSKFSAVKLQNSRCIIRSLSLLRYDVNSSTLEVRNLYEFIKRNFMFFFPFFFLSALNFFRKGNVFFFRYRK